MNILDLDAGNSRLKWCLQTLGKEPEYGVVSNQSPELMIGELHKAVGSKTVDMCRLSSVRSAEVVNDVRREIAKVFLVQPRLPEPISGVGGVVVEKVDASRLGCDRWLAMLGAKALYPKDSVMIVDAGTALTLDVVGADGMFLGGYICPGLNTMLKSVTDSADLLVMPEVPEFFRVPAFPSIQAIQNGALSMASALIEKEFERLGGGVRVIMCGGDAALLAENMTIPVDYRPELIFDGLAVALPARDA